MYALERRIIAPMQTPISKVLSRLMAHQGLSQVELHRRSRVGQSTISRILNPGGPKGIKDPTDKQVRPLAEFFGVTSDQLRGHDPLPAEMLDPRGESNTEPGPPITTAPRRIEIMGTAQLGDGGFWEGLDAADGWVETYSRDENAYALRLKGDSMAPAIRDGWIAVCEPGHRLVPGEYVKITLRDGRSMVKELLFENSEAVSVMSINSAHGRHNFEWGEITDIHYVGAILPPSKVLCWI